MKRISPRVAVRRRMVLGAVSLLLVAVAHLAAAGMYTWVDDQGDRHLVDSREKVPPKYRSRAREVSPEDSRPAAPMTRDTQSAPEARSPRAGTGRSSEDVARDGSPRGRASASEAATGWIDRLRARWVSGLPAVPSVREHVARWLPRQRALALAGVVGAAAVLMRVVAAVAAFRAARRLVEFAARYRSFLGRRSGRSEQAQVDRLEADLPAVHRWCRGAQLGVTTIGASREVGMGRVMDEGRVDVVSACLTRPELVGQHMLAVLARAEGVHRHRARRALSPLGCLEILAYWPRYVVWRRADAEVGGVRVLLALYWLVALSCALAI